MALFLHTKRRGFTLAELAIVMALIGLFLGLIWIAASAVLGNNKTSLAVQQIGQVTQNIREYYMNATGMGCGDVTATLDGQGVFPAEMRGKCTTCTGSNFQINSPFVTASGPNAGIKSGSFRVIGTGAGCPAGKASQFQIVLTNLPQSACQRLLLSGVAFKDQSMGVARVCGASETGGATPCYSNTSGTGTGGWYNVSCSNATGVCDTTTALTTAQAQTMCASSSTSETAWEFLLRH